MKKILFTLFICCGAVSLTQAQIDPHFSQYYANPLWLNPALTGVIDGNFRLNANFKSQWGNVENGYKTGGLTADYRTTDRMGFGFSVTNQAAGTAGYNYMAAYGSFSYGIELSNKFEYLNFGVQAGIINRGVNAAKFQSDSQYDPNTGFNPNLPHMENLIATNASVFDAGAGLFYHDDEPYKNANLFAGASVFHLSRPNDPFIVEGKNYKLPVRINIHAGARVSVSDYLSMTPHGIYIKQNENDIIALGANTEFTFENDNAFIVGGMFRFNDAAIANIGFRLPKLNFGASYDFNTSDFKSASKGRGGLEFSIGYVFGRGKYGPPPMNPRF